MGNIRLSGMTIFTTPILNGLLRLLSLAYLKAFGWRIEGNVPEAERFVMIAAPHTSNWDLPMTLVVVFALRLKVYYLAKHTLFRPPFGFFLRWLGGIPVDRTKSNNLVEQIVAIYESHDQLVIIVPPEGTRSKVRYWKSGFYHIANGAKVPIALGFIDFKKKMAGIKGMFIPSGDFDADLPKIQSFYSGIVGKNPDN